MKLAFYKSPGKFLNKMIRWWTKSEYSHVELVFEPKGGDLLYKGSRCYRFCWSSSFRDEGVRFKLIEVIENDKWDLVDLPLVSSGEEEMIKHWCRSKVGASYGVKDIAKFVVPFLRSKGGQWFCSEACLTALQAHLMFLGERPDKVHPGRLAEIVRDR